MPPDQGRHGPHPADRRLFAPVCWPILRSAVADLSWLLTRGYAPASALKLVGDHYQLRQRQRVAVQRCACSDQARRSRLDRQLPAQALRGQRLLIDGFNVVVTIEAALAGGVLLHARDGCLRDMASMHGNYRRGRHTQQTIELIGQTLAQLGAQPCAWLLDRPVSNSGRLKAMLLETAAQHQWPWEAAVVDNPDRELIDSPDPVATSDSAVLDRCGRWFALTRYVVAHRLADAEVIELDARES